MASYKFRIGFSTSVPQKALEAGHSVHSSLPGEELFLAGNFSVGAEQCWPGDGMMQA